MCHFLVCQVFQNCAKNSKNLPKFQKWVLNNRNDTKCLPVLSFCVQLQIFCFKTFPNWEVPFLGYLKTPKMGTFGVLRYLKKGTSQF